MKPFYLGDCPDPTPCRGTIWKITQVALALYSWISCSFYREAPWCLHQVACLLSAYVLYSSFASFGPEKNLSEVGGRVSFVREVARTGSVFVSSAFPLSPSHYKWVASNLPFWNITRQKLISDLLLNCRQSIANIVNRIYWRLNLLHLLPVLTMFPIKSILMLLVHVFSRSSSLYLP